MADEPKAEEKTRAKSPSTAASKPRSASKATKSTSKKTRAASKSKSVPAEELAEAYEAHLANIATAQQEAIFQQVNALQKCYSELGALQKDMLAADPSSAFLSDLVRAYRSGDPKAVVDAYRSLASHYQQTQAKVERRYREILKTYANESTEVARVTSEKIVDEGKQYAQQTLEAVEGADVEAVDATTKGVLAHSLMVSALTTPTEPKSGHEPEE